MSKYITRVATATLHPELGRLEPGQELELTAAEARRYGGLVKKKAPAKTAKKTTKKK